MPGLDWTCRLVGGTTGTHYSCQDPSTRTTSLTSSGRFSFTVSLVRASIALTACTRCPASTLCCVGRPVVSAALPAEPSGEFQPAVDAERRGHRVHPPRCLSLPLSNSLHRGSWQSEEALGHQVGPTNFEGKLVISALFRRLSNEICQLTNKQDSYEIFWLIFRRFTEFCG